MAFIYETYTYFIVEKFVANIACGTGTGAFSAERREVAYKCRYEVHSPTWQMYTVDGYPSTSSSTSSSFHDVLSPFSPHNHASLRVSEGGWIRKSCFIGTDRKRRKKTCLWLSLLVLISKAYQVAKKINERKSECLEKGGGQQACGAKEIRWVWRTDLSLDILQEPRRYHEKTPFFSALFSEASNQRVYGEKESLLPRFLMTSKFMLSLRVTTRFESQTVIAIVRV